MEKEDRKCNKAIEKAIKQAIKEADKKSWGLQAMDYPAQPVASPDQVALPALL